MIEEFIKNCPLCFRKPEVTEYTKDGTRYFEICHQNESHCVAVYALTKARAIRQWNNGIPREPVSEVEEKENGNSIRRT